MPSGHQQIRRTVPLPAERAARYRRAGLWGASRLGDGIERWARLGPDRRAVVDASGTRTYRQLDGDVATAVALLHAWGVVAGDAVVVVAPPRYESLVAHHAVLRSGAISVLLDHRCGRSDLANAVDSTGARLLIGPAEVLRSLRADELPVPPDAHSLEGLLDQPPVAGRPSLEPDPGDPAMVVFTSGTTGRPKGVVHSLDTIGATTQALVASCGLDAESTIAVVKPVASISGVLTALHAPFGIGACVMLEADWHATASMQRLRACGATFLGAAPVMVEQMARQGVTPPPSLRTVSVGGARVDAPSIDAFCDRFGGALVRLYGSTEAPLVATTMSSASRRPPTIGGAVADGVVVDGAEVRVGSRHHPNEGLVRGPMVCLGYLDAAHGAESFEGEWYRTGDLLEVDVDRLRVTGRLKEIVIRNGWNISIAEVEEALGGLPGVAELAAFGMADPATGERLAVAVRTDAGADLPYEALAARLASAGLPRYKFPEQVVTWHRPLPRTASGKVARQALAEAAEQHPGWLAPRLARCVGT